MNASELRIGNRVQEGEYELTVGVIDAHYHSIQIHGSPRKIPIENISPIPLTEEWLLKFGCKGQQITMFKLNYWNKEKDFSIDVELNGHERLFYYLVCNQDRRKSLLYVHQLQNLYFALTGEELTIK